MKNLKRIIIVAVILATIFAYDYYRHNKVYEVIERDIVNSVTSTYSKNGEEPYLELKAEENLTLVEVNGGSFIIDNNILFDMLERYSSVRSRNEYFPSESQKIKVEFKLYQNHKLRHIVLGEFNVWYETNNKPFDIIDGDKLLAEILTYVNTNDDKRFLP